MNISKKLLAGFIAVATCLPLTLLPIQAHAEYRNERQISPRIEGFNVDEVRHLRPGAELDFIIYGTPGGHASLRISGAVRSLVLIEIEAGRYAGTYTVSSRDRIGARSQVTANLRVGNLVASRILNESLQIGVGNHTDNKMAGPKPRIERFEVEQISDLGGGNDLRFTVRGTAGGKADLTIAGIKGKIFLSEVRKGEYATTYTIKNRDRIKSNSVVTANLRIGERSTSMTLGKALQSAAAPAPVVHHCQNCGAVEAINLVEVNGDGSYLGTIGGGVIGALIGSQVGGGNGRTAAQIAGAVGGAYAGRAIESNARKSNHYEVLVRFDNGATQTVSYATNPGFLVGDKVKVTDGVIARRS